MAREKMVTRTVSAINVTVMGINTATASAVTEVKVMTGAYKDDADLLKAIKKAYDGEIVWACITSKEIVETLYGMPESEFMKYAKVLPPRTKAD